MRALTCTRTTVRVCGHVECVWPAQGLQCNSPVCAQDPRAAVGQAQRWAAGTPDGTGDGSAGGHACTGQGPGHPHRADVLLVFSPEKFLEKQTGVVNATSEPGRLGLSTLVT